VSSTSASITTSHKYTQTGTYTVTLSVFDSLHQQVIRSVRVKVRSS